MWLLLKKANASLGVVGVCGALAHNAAQACSADSCDGGYNDYPADIGHGQFSPNFNYSLERLEQLLCA